VIPIFKRLGLGSVLGYLVAGVAIGPWGLRLVADPKTVLQIAEFGVVLLLFLVGLELNAQRVWALRRAIFGLGGVQVAATIAAVTGIGVALGQPLAVSAIAGMGFAMSSTAIGLATLTEKNLLPTPGGQASFAVLLFQDLAVIPLLLVVGLLGGEAETLKWADAAKALGMIALLIVAGRLLVRPALRYVAESRLREVFVGFSLLLVLGTAALMEWVGLSMALGAFLAGVLLAESEYRHELELDIDPFKGLLLGLFFMAVGMSVDLGLFLRIPHVILALTLGLVALKMLLLFYSARLFGYCRGTDAGLFAVALSQVGEFAFVLFTAAANVLPPATIALLNAVVATSMLTTPPLMMLYQRFVVPRLGAREERAADGIRESNPVIIAGFGRFGQIVGRILRVKRIPFTALDSNQTHVDFVRKFGNKVYYGDASRLDLLRAAGAETAKVFVLAIDDVEASTRTAQLVRAQFPHLKVFARARNRQHAFALMDAGVRNIIRETYASSLEMAASVLEALGTAPAAVRDIVRKFRQHDEATLAAQYEVKEDEAKFTAAAREAAQQLEKLFEADEGKPG